MSYLILARKYRPYTFEDVVAQEHITKTLANSIAHDRLGSGYLFCGPRGTGKTTTARILAKAINCEKGPSPIPCGECSSCREITAGSSLDVLEIDAASNTGVDDIRSLRENVRYMPTKGLKRVYIIDEVHRLSGAAFDALLKTLEEPPPHVMFIFATTEPGKVPETILSRTQRYDFKRVSIDDLANHLKKLCDSEKIEADPEALKLLARKADGSVRDSLSLLDQIAAFAGNKISAQDVIEGLGLVDRKFLFDFVDTVAAKDAGKILGMIKSLLESGTDIRDFVGELMEHLRILMIISAAPEAGDLLSLTSTEMDQYQKQAHDFAVGDIVRLMKMCDLLSRDLRSGLNERLLLEMTAVKMTQLESTVVLSELLQKINGQTSNMADDLFGTVKKKSSPQPVENQSRDKLTLTRSSEAAPPPSPPPSFTSRAVNFPIVREGWDSFLVLLKRRSPMLSAQLAMAKVQDVRDNQISLMFGAAGEMAKQLVEKKENLATITETLRDHFHAAISLQIDLNMDDHEKPPGTAKAEQEEKIDVKNLVDRSDRIKSIIERFDGEVIGVKKVE
ncbi:MAG: DNA polymerase III subunit gamma/tau [bacterium]|nr:DNA polymerase III subunit gamma/tau [bacterium]